MSTAERFVEIALGEVGKPIFGVVTSFLGYNLGVELVPPPPARTPIKEANMHSESIISRFWSYVDVSDDLNACWEWKRSRIHDGYGRFKAANHQWRSHRFAWTITNGPIPDGLVVLHKCDNPGCCNPSHLELGTVADNTLDKMHKGRFQDQTGDRNPFAKLTADDVRSIRLARQQGETQRSLAKRYNVTPSNISCIVRRISWSHLQ